MLSARAHSIPRGSGQQPRSGLRPIVDGFGESRATSSVDSAVAATTPSLTRSRAGAIPRWASALRRSNSRSNRFQSLRANVRTALRTIHARMRKPGWLTKVFGRTLSTNSRAARFARRRRRLWAAASGRPRRRQVCGGERQSLEQRHVAGRATGGRAPAVGDVV
jgi:hypothetical protein